MAKLILLDKVNTINRIGNYKKNELFSYKLDIAYGGYRLTQLVNKSGGETDISPRLPAKEMKQFLEGFIKGMDAYRQSRSDIEYKKIAKDMGL